MHRLISTAYKKAMDILKKNRTILNAMAEALLRYETISGDEVDMLIGGDNLDDIEKKRDEHDITLEQERKESAQRMKKKEKESSIVQPVGKPDPVIT